MKKQMLKHGFTLVEIMIVVAIIGILAAIAIPNFVKSRKRSQTNACISNLKQIEGAIEQWRMEPGNAAGTPELAALMGEEGWIKGDSMRCPSNDTEYTIEDGVPTCSFDAGEGYEHVLPTGAAAEEGEG